MSTGSLVRHYLELALEKGNAPRTVHQPDVQIELRELAESLDRQDEALRLARAMMTRLEQIERHLEALREAAQLGGPQ
jgi:hypothetical protein